MKKRLVVLADRIYLSLADISAEDDVFIRNEKDEFVSDKSSASVVLKNILELCNFLECKSYINVDVYGGIVNYKSEINVRVAFSGFIGVASNSFRYFDSENNIVNRVETLTRVFNSLAVDPRFEKLNDVLELNFNIEDYRWRYFKIQKVVENVTKKTLDIDSFVRMLSEAYEGSKPLSYFRVGHCENRLVGQGFSFDISEMEITYQIQFGYSINVAQTKILSHKMLEAFRNADILGVPSIKPMSSNKLHLLENSTYVHLAEYNCYKEKYFTPVNLHFDLGVYPKFKDFLQSVDNLYAITGRSVGVLEKCLGRKIVHLDIPAEYMFNDDPGMLKHYPDRFDEIVEFIKARISTKDVVLVGAGILGKLYCEQVRASGGIAIDLGSLFDAMVGIQSRGCGFNQNFWWCDNESE